MSDATIPRPPVVLKITPQLVVIPAASVLWRCNSAAYPKAMFFGNAVAHRFDDPAGGYGVMYVSQSEFGALSETILHGRLRGTSQRSRTLSTSRFDKFRLAAFTVTKPITLVDLADGGHARLGLDAAIMVHVGRPPYHATRPWSQAVHRSWPRVDGIRYQARHLSSQYSIALFDRAKSKLCERTPQQRIGSALRTRFLDLTGFVLDVRP